MNQSLDSIFQPKSIAVVGISRRKDSLGQKLLRNLISFGYTGELYPVNRKAEFILELKVYPTLSDIPTVPELVISFVPKDYVLSLVEECANLRVRGIIIITAGFRESNKEGLELELKIGAIAKEAGIRVVGPNSMGVLNGSSPMMNASFSPINCSPGTIGLISQSGALGAVIMQYANEVGLGFSKFVSIGNKLDINANHLLTYYLKDEKTSVILCYMESFIDPSRFLKIARTVSPKKPIVMVKSGTTAQGSKAALSHTGALASNDTITDVALRSAGIIRTRTVKDMVDVGLALEKNSPPRGRKIAIVSNAGGPGTLTTDFAVENGLEIPDLNPRTIQELAKILPPEATIANPVDILPSADAETYRAVTQLLLQDPSIDSVVVLALPPVLITLKEILNVLSELCEKNDKPVFCVAMGCEEELSPYPEVPFPIYKYPSTLGMVISHLAEYFEWISGEPRELPESHGANPILSSYSGGILPQDDVERVLTDYSFTLPSQAIIESMEELSNAVDRIGYPLVVKLASTILTHKSDHKGVFLGIKTYAELKDTYTKIIEIFERNSVPISDRKILIQTYINGGVEVVLGLVNDPVFGRAVMVGSGGTMVELFGDVIFLSVPFCREDLKSKIKDLKLFELLRGYRGEQGGDIKGLLDNVMGLQQLALDNPNIKELDINPLISLPDRNIVVDARIVTS